LLIEIEHFIDCIETGATPRTNGNFGAEVVSAIEMATNLSWRVEEPSYLAS